MSQPHLEVHRLINTRQFQTIRTQVLLLCAVLMLVAAVFLSLAMKAPMPSKLTLSVTAVASVMGYIGFGFLADVCGRKTGILAALAVCTVAAGMLLLLDHSILMMAARALLAVGSCGLLCCVLTMAYEFSHSRKRFLVLSCLLALLALMTSCSVLLIRLPWFVQSSWLASALLLSGILISIACAYWLWRYLPDSWYFWVSTQNQPAILQEWQRMQLQTHAVPELHMPSTDSKPILWLYGAILGGSVSAHILLAVSMLLNFYIVSVAIVPYVSIAMRVNVVMGISFLISIVSTVGVGWMMGKWPAQKVLLWLCGLAAVCALILGSGWLKYHVVRAVLLCLLCLLVFAIGGLASGIKMWVVDVIPTAYRARAWACVYAAISLIPILGLKLEFFKYLNHSSNLVYLAAPVLTVAVFVWLMERSMQK